MEFLSNPFVDAFGYTMIHALWQFTAISLVYFLIVKLIPKLSARQKFELGGLSLLLQLVVSFGTFMWLAFPQTGGATAQLINITDGNDLTLLVNATAGRNWISMLVLIWMVGFTFCITRLGMGWFSITKLKNTGLPIQNKLNSHLKQLAKKINIPSNISFLESNLIRVPMTMNHFKPIIFFPIGLINQLTPTQVEAILIHELAHIKYNDYVLNLFFSFIEAIFFFHPVVWWMSSQMNHFREESCDEQVLKVTNGPMEYAKALVLVQEFSNKSIPTAMALTGKKGPLMKRIEKILTGKNKLRQKREFVFPLLFIFIIASGLSIATLSANHESDEISGSEFFEELGEKLETKSIAEIKFSSESFPSENLELVMPRDTDDVNVFVIKNKDGSQSVKFKHSFKDDNEEKEIEIENGEVTKLKINGKLIPKENYANHSDLINEIKSFYDEYPASELLDRIPPPPPAPPHPPKAPQATLDRLPPAPPKPPVPIKDIGELLDELNKNSILDKKELESIAQQIIEQEKEYNGFVEYVLSENAINLEDQLALLEKRLNEHLFVSGQIEEAMEKLNLDIQFDLADAQILQLENLAQLKHLELEGHILESQNLIDGAHSLFGLSEAHPGLFDGNLKRDMEAFKKVLRKELESDKLIKKDGRIKMQMTQERVKVNGKKLNARQSLKYKKLFEKHNQHLPTENFRIHLYDDARKASYSNSISS